MAKNPDTEERNFSRFGAQFLAEMKISEFNIISQIYE